MPAAPNSTYVYMSPLQQLIWDKDLNVPLAGGIVKFWSDAAFTVPKNVYAQNQTAPFAFVSVGATLTLSIIGTFVNPNDGTNFIPFMWPFQGDPATPPSPLVSEPYFIQVFSSSNVLQFTLSDWPPNAEAIQTSTSFTSVNVQTFSVAGATTYTPITGMQYCIVQVLGAGGGGGGAGAAGAGLVTLGGAGGAGAYSEGIFSAVTIGVSQVVTVGTGGANGAAGANAGAAGTASSLGALLTAPGGSGGAASSAASQSAAKAGAAGGVAGTGGYLNAPGMRGGLGFGLYADSPGAAAVLATGAPGSTPYGSGTQTTAGAAAAGSGYGAGGGAGSAFNSGAVAGASGRSGLVIITEYVSS